MFIPTMSSTARVLRLALGMLCLAGGVFAIGQTQTILYSFTGGRSGIPSGRIAFDSAGALYGTAESGIFGFGSVFSLTPPSAPGGSWIEADLYEFKGDHEGIDGAVPTGGVVIDGTGSLYGTTTAGGTSNRGTSFDLIPAWDENILHSFGGAQNGMTPASSLLRVKNGTLLGTTKAGGSSGAGTVFKLTPPTAGKTLWTENILYSFTGGSDGGTPSGEVTVDKSGALYGMTNKGGSGFGVVFRLTPPSVAGGAWTESVLYTFAGSSDGANPLGGLIFDATGTLYGTTSQGGASNCGTVFKLTPPSSGGNRSFGALYAFTGVLDGCEPAVSLTAGRPGVLFGTTFMGGQSSGAGDGTVFELAFSQKEGKWNETVLHRFAGNGANADGDAPDAPMVLRGGALYGTTRGGGPNNNGIIFKIVP